MSSRPCHSRAIVRAAFATLQQNPRLMWFPVLAMAGSAAVFVLTAALSGLVSWVAVAPVADLGPLGTWSHDATTHAVTVRGRVTGGLTLAFGLQLVTTVCAVALAKATLEALAGRPWTVSQTLKETSKRLGPVATYALVSTWIGRFLGKGKRRSSLTRSLVRLSWWAATYLVIPVLARENRGGLASIARSSQLFRDTWKEVFVGRLTLGWLWLPFVLVVIGPIGLCLLVGVDDQRVLMAAVGAPLALAAAATLFIRTLDTIYRTALYVFATEGVVPGPFDDPSLDDIWVACRTAPPQPEPATPDEPGITQDPKDGEHSEDPSSSDG